MRVLDTEKADRVPLYRRIPVGVWVAATLMVLLHGPTQAFWALLGQAWSLVATLLGGDQVVLAVLCQTAPLALATALIVLLVCRELITFESSWSLLACAGILIGGASLGAELRTVMQRMLPAEAAAADPSQTARSGTKYTVQSLEMWSRLYGGRVPADKAYGALTDWRYVSELGASSDWPERIPRVGLLPEGSSAFGIVGRGVNQLLGYLVFYRPRMFFAALLAGGYLGWLTHRRLAWLDEQVTDRAAARRLERERRAA